MNTRVFGKSLQRVGQWVFPRAIADKGLVGELNFKGHQAEMVLEESDELIDVCAPDPERNALWKYLLGKHKEGAEIVSKKENFTDEDLTKFRKIT